MRKLLIKLVALETALVGWLAYWLFLVYSNNPSVAEGLGSQLSRFPQLSFTTVDITVLVIIGVLSILLAFKFQRGLKPGIRLERALQMLENLMKRNLMLEAQVAEMKLEKAQIMTPPSNAGGENRIGSWEKVFRTPIEAGPASPGQSSRLPPFGAAEKEPKQEPQAQGSQSTRIDAKPPIQAGSAFAPQESPVKTPEKTPPFPDKPLDKPSLFTSTPIGSSSWEDNPKFRVGTGNTLGPSPAKSSLSATDTLTSRQPYIPVPVPKVIPSSVIVGPGSSPVQQPKPLASSPARFVASPQSSQKASRQAQAAQTKSSETLPQSDLSTLGNEMTRQSQVENSSTETTVKASPKEGSEKPAKSSGRSTGGRKRFPWEDEQS